MERWIREARAHISHLHLTALRGHFGFTPPRARCYHRLVRAALEAYGDVGVYDPAQLAKIDFLNQPDLLIDLVRAAKPSASTSVRLPPPSNQAAASLPSRLATEDLLAESPRCRVASLPIRLAAESPC